MTLLLTLCLVITHFLKILNFYSDSGSIHPRFWKYTSKILEVHRYHTFFIIDFMNVLTKKRSSFCSNGTTEYMSGLFPSLKAEQLREGWQLNSSCSQESSKEVTFFFLPLYKLYHSKFPVK